MDSLQLSQYLSSVQERYHKEILALYGLSDANYDKLCNDSNKDFSNNNFNIKKDHTIDEYFGKYGNEFIKGRALAFKKDELWLMNQMKPNTTYWEIPNDSGLLYFEVPSKTRNFILIPLLVLFLAGGIGLGIGINHLMNSSGSVTPTPTPTPTPDPGPDPDPDPPEPPSVKKWYEYTEAEGWWNYCSSGVEGEEATENDIGQTVKMTLNGLEHEIRLIDIDHLEPSESEGQAQAHCTFEFVNPISRINSYGEVAIYGAPWENYATNTNFIIARTNQNLQPGGNIYSMFPTGDDDLIDKMLTVTKYVGIKPDGGGPWSISSYTTKLFPLAHDEMYDTDQDLIPNEGSKYAYYKNHTTNDDRIKKTPGWETGDRVPNYWLRSPYVDGLTTDKAWYVGQDGAFANQLTNYSSSGVAPAFCI